MYQGQSRKRRVNPRETANIFSWLTFFYTLELFKKGYKQNLEQQDLYEVLKSCQAQPLGELLENQWEIEKNKRKPSIFRAIWSCFGWTYMKFGLVQCCMSTIMVIVTPEALGKLISYFTPGQTELTKTDAYYYASIVIGFNIINFIYTHNYTVMLIEFGIRVKTALCSLIYRKSLKLSNASLSETTVGRITTIITKDIDALEMVILMGNDIWVGFVQTIIICYLIYNKIGVATFAGFGVHLIILPIQIIIGRMGFSFRLKSSKKTDERLQATQETLSAIKIIKMYTWERFFVGKINKARKEELKILHQLFYTKILILVIGNLCSKIAFFLLIMTYVWLNNNASAEIVYFIMSCFNKLQNMVSYLMPYGISYAAEVYALFVRIESILFADELPPPKDNFEATISPKIVLKDVTATVRSIEILKDISLTIENGLNVVVGHVGSGKTTFLKTILQDVKLKGDLEVFGRISYSSQEPWLFPSSIKNNILFGEDYNEARYRKVLQVCALNYDLESFIYKDETIIGDRGLNVSKGQQARISLARAIYRDCDIYLLDDCLSALDANVSDNIFRNCLKQFLKNKLIIFVTNNHVHIRQADNVIIINQGFIKSSTKPESIIKNDEVEENNEDQKELSPADEEQNRQVYFEAKKSGKVPIKVYVDYVRFGGGFILVFLLMGLFVFTQFTISYADKLVSEWVTLEQNLTEFTTNNSNNSVNFVELYEQRSHLLKNYGIMVATSTILTFIKAFSFFNVVRKASSNLHRALVRSLVNATMYFFDTFFIGNMLNRLSKDLFVIDEYLPFVIIECLEMFFVVGGAIILLTTVDLIFLIQSIVLFILAYFVRWFYIRTGRNLQRLEALTRSPMIGHLNSTLEGLTTIRAFKTQKNVENEFDKHQELFSSANYQLNHSLSALGFVLDLLSNTFVASIIIRFLFFDTGSTVGDIGMVITQTFLITELIQSGVKNWSDFENEMTCVERALEFTQLSQESHEGLTVDNWPVKGNLRFEKVSLNYNDKGQAILKNISFRAVPNKTIGIVGRTGAGKSSIISTLFRLYEYSGKIIIDGVDIQDLSLSHLRSKIAIIPQDPILFSGTIRGNIDPLKKFTDQEIWLTIETVKLKNLIVDLDMKIDFASNFSAGQKQLICLARALINKNRIVVMDEATANMDQETDALIRTIVQEKFSHCTVIIIAHRLVSVLSSYKVMVVHGGEIVEFDEPRVLLQNKKSMFYKMVKQVTLEQDLLTNKTKLNPEYNDKRYHLLKLIGFMLLASFILMPIRGYYIYAFMMRASFNLNRAITENIVNAKLTFFDSFCVGNILNRLSKDYLSIDEFLPQHLEPCFKQMFFVGGALILLVTVKTIFLLQALVYFALAFLIAGFYTKTARDVERLLAIVRSPLVGHINSTLEGLTTIRAQKTERSAQQQYDHCLNITTSAYFISQSFIEALNFASNLLSSVFISSIIISLFLVRGNTVGDVGLVINQTFMLTELVKELLRHLVEVENKMTATERALEFLDIQQERSDGLVVKDWNRNGEISFENVSLNYTDKKQKGLENISFSVNPKDHIGIVGRTGAGKSSIISALFQLYDYSGKIIIDGFDVESLNLNYFRSKISVIPQDPVIFTGTIRSNIDPLDKFTDNEIWKIIKLVKLDNLITDLNMGITLSTNLSSGQKQLICLARVLINKNQILVMDEPTSNLDQETECFMNQIIEEEFKKCTTITIAHRLKSVLNSNKVMVISDGKIAEFGEPSTLLNNNESLFCKTIKQF